MSLLPRPFDRWTTYPGHGGIDYPQARGAAVRASGRGVVDWSGYYSAVGGFAKFITYDCGCRHGYYHFDREQGLRRGDRVDYGTVFAYVGSLGLNSNGPHLHHEVWNGHSSIIRPPAYWNYVDANRYVGDGSAAGGGGAPLPIPEPKPPTIEQESTMQVARSIKDDVGGGLWPQGLYLVTENGVTYAAASNLSVVNRLNGVNANKPAVELYSSELKELDERLRAVPR